MDLQKVLDRIPEEWGKTIRCGEGWFPLIAELDERLNEIDPDYVVHQCKEKFGGLRFYAHHSPSVSAVDAARFLELVCDAEERSRSVCERCGASGGTVKIGHWHATLCERHMKESP